MAKKKAAPKFDYATWAQLTTASIAPSLSRDDRQWVTLPDGELIIVYCGWRWAYGVVFVLRTPNAGHAETFFSKIRKPVKGELATDIPADWVPEQIGWQLDYTVENNTARSWGKQLKEALKQAGDVRIPNIPKKYL